MRVGLVQLTVSDDPAANLPETLRLVRAAAAGGAEFVLTPEDAGCRWPLCQPFIRDRPGRGRRCAL